MDIAEGLSDLVAEFLDVYLRKLLTLAELFNPTVNFVFHLCVIIASASVVREKDRESTTDAAPWCYHHTSHLLV